MPSLIKFAGPGSLKDVDRTQGVITAYAASFDNVDADGDVIRPGAFAKTIRERGPAGTQQIKMLFMHRFTEIIGKVLHLEEDGHGLLFRAKLLLGLQRARDALELYSADMFEHSIGIDVILPERFRGGEILEAKLFDVSPVTFGANDQTPTLSVKSLSTEGDALGSQVRKIRKALSLDLSDEVLADLEIGLVILEARVGALIKRQKGTTLAALLNNLIEARITEERSRADIVRLLAEAAGITTGPVNAILSADIVCPFMNGEAFPTVEDRRAAFGAWARILGTTQSRLISAAERDGCNYDTSKANYAGVLQGVLSHLKANPAPPGTGAVDDTLAADGPQMDQWLREVLTNLRQSHA